MASIRTDKPAGEALRRLARKTLAALAKDFDRAASGLGVHAARRRLKFMRSLLRLLRPAIGEAAFAKADRRLRAAAHAVAGARRAEALPEAVAKLAPAAGQGALAELARLAAAAHGHAAVETLREAVAGARRDIEKLRGAINGWSLPKRRVAPFVAGFRDAYRSARHRLRKGLAAGDIAGLHEARKPVIHHLHHLEILKPLMPRLAGERQAGLARLRQALGDLNDLDELERLAAAHERQFSSPAARREVHAAIGRRRVRLLARVELYADNLFAEAPGAFAKRLAAMQGKSAA